MEKIIFFCQKSFKLKHKRYKMFSDRTICAAGPFFFLWNSLDGKFNPKRAGLFGPILQRGGGADSVPLRSRKPIDKTSSVWY